VSINLFFSTHSSIFVICSSQKSLDMAVTNKDWLLKIMLLFFIPFRIGEIMIILSYLF